MKYRRRDIKGLCFFHRNQLPLKRRSCLTVKKKSRRKENFLCLLKNKQSVLCALKRKIREIDSVESYIAFCAVKERVFSQGNGGDEGGGAIK